MAQVFPLLPVLYTEGMHFSNECVCFYFLFANPVCLIWRNCFISVRKATNCRLPLSIGQVCVSLQKAEVKWTCIQQLNAFQFWCLQSVTPFHLYCPSMLFNKIEMAHSATSITVATNKSYNPKICQWTYCISKLLLAFYGKNAETSYIMTLKQFS